MDGDTYTVSKRSAQVGFGPADGPKSDIYREANDFCGKQGKKVQNRVIANDRFRVRPTGQRFVAIPLYVSVTGVAVNSRGSY